ncbi:hypothetical protein BU23DRAFT_549874 [Bimuria novae-zelandiae CBS 107.79]|uniref:Long chronological lifespan protein 2 n=1 Tax=Bimuria novae-zelandiae CBS 107.79 TaxID=1447943 RepID=A0A6A5VRV3_9PLEO|nr:hypothetical protein BU23DRAFT_549874 [Bimuria novae-zelandiae CBS 107.79]
MRVIIAATAFFVAVVYAAPPLASHLAPRASYPNCECASTSPATCPRSECNWKRDNVPVEPEKRIPICCCTGTDHQQLQCL